MLPRKGLTFSKLPIGCNLINGRNVLLLLLIGCAWANQKEENKNFAVTHNDGNANIVGMVIDSNLLKPCHNQRSLFSFTHYCYLRYRLLVI